MQKLFLSYSFRDEDRSLVSQVERLLASHHLLVVTGQKLGGEMLTPAVMERIESCDGLVSLLTRREQKASGTWTTHDWVRDELNHARGKNMRAIAMVEDGVDVGGAYGEHERIHFSRESLEEAFLALSETIGVWKAEAGRQLKIQILPEILAEQAAMTLGEMSCQYRFGSAGNFTEWKQALQVPEEGGTFIYITGVKDDQMIQLRISHAGTQWQSRFISAQSLPVELKQSGGSQ